MLKAKKTLFSSLLLGLAFATFGYAADKTNTALVIIDMQPEFVTRGGDNQTPENKLKVKQILESNIATIKMAEKLKIPIIFLEYERHGATTDTLKKEIANYKPTTILLKNTDGAFDSSNTHKGDLIDYLSKNKIRTLIITGANGGGCVLQTIQGALDEKFSIIAYSKGIADFNYHDFIYPYKKMYHFDTNEKDGTFREANDLSDIFPEKKVVPKAGPKENNKNKTKPAQVNDTPSSE